MQNDDHSPALRSGHGATTGATVAGNTAGTLKTSDDDVSLLSSVKGNGPVDLFRHIKHSRPHKEIMRESYPRLENGEVKRDVPLFDPKRQTRYFKGVYKKD